ncbi:hypothetical protein GCM10023235_48920 [Kitasatospora terrestris]|uniref:Uncharacterized protein n=1 Tax=Kitasatospora terrestris TaxID=258051 RepID=A0ABP9E2P4_9ACTN
MPAATWIAPASRAVEERTAPTVSMRFTFRFLPDQPRMTRPHLAPGHRGRHRLGAERVLDVRVVLAPVRSGGVGPVGWWTGSGTG